jgi:hypothetical protein
MIWLCEYYGGAVWWRGYVVCIVSCNTCHCPHLCATVRVFGGIQMDRTSGVPTWHHQIPGYVRTGRIVENPVSATNGTSVLQESKVMVAAPRQLPINVPTLPDVGPLSPTASTSVKQQAPAYHEDNFTTPPPKQRKKRKTRNWQDLSIN